MDLFRHSLRATNAIVARHLPCLEWSRVRSMCFPIVPSAVVIAFLTTIVRFTKKFHKLISLPNKKFAPVECLAYQRISFIFFALKSVCVCILGRTNLFLRLSHSCVCVEIDAPISKNCAVNSHLRRIQHGRDRPSRNSFFPSFWKIFAVFIFLIHFCSFLLIQNSKKQTHTSPEAKRSEFFARLDRKWWWQSLPGQHSSLPV